ncbi:hypothetical protein K410107C12_07710 [Agathobacter rectalis]|jgi:hypothetical protein
MKEQIAKFIMGIFCILIVVVVAIRICFLRGQWINGLFCGHINKGCTQVTFSSIKARL